MTIKTFLPIAFAAFVLAASARASPRPTNVLFIAVDDLRPALGCYGDQEVLSPNIDRLASTGVTFTRAYCQYPICRASRPSVLTGLRPDSMGRNVRPSAIRRLHPDLITLPQLFKNHGYHTQSFGKIYHGSFETAYAGRSFDDPASWSAPGWFGSPQYYFTREGMAVARDVYAKKAKEVATPEQWKSEFVQGLTTEAPDVSDHVPYDGAMTDAAIRTLRSLNGKPFFLGVGFMKPHLPFVAPKKYWDLYDRSKLSLPSPTTPPSDAPPVARESSGELRGQYTDARNDPLSEAQTRELRHGYYACVSYVDELIGRLLAEVDRLGLRENTIIVLWGDHGWHLGEQGLWAKMTGFEYSARVPLIVSGPGVGAAGKSSAALVELVDLFPSLCELTGLSAPAKLEGSSFASLLTHPEQSGKTAAFTQLVRGAVTGRSIRTERYRFTRWHDTKAPDQTVALELYDYLADPVERENLAARPEHARLVEELRTKLEAGAPRLTPSSL